jgi:hypothetical protein
MNDLVGEIMGARGGAGRQAVENSRLLGRHGNRGELLWKERCSKMSASCLEQPFLSAVFVATMANAEDLERGK